MRKMLAAIAIAVGLLGIASPAEASIDPVQASTAVHTSATSELVWGQKTAVTLPTCSSTGICFYANPNNLPLTGFSQSSARGVCRSVPPDHTAYIENNTIMRWYVYQTRDCTGIRAPVYPGTSDWMSGMWYLTIKSTIRTSSLT
jgi:hypothetical protein